MVTEPVVATFNHPLDHGWKVSPVCGNDNHGTAGISRNTSRTFVLAKNRTKAAILDAMKNRRTYASLDKNIQCRYTVNRAIMGSTAINDPDTDNPKDKYTIDDSSSKFFFVRIWNAGGGDAPGVDPGNPVAWLAPVWTGTR
jgi:hypothetical protein